MRYWVCQTCKEGHVNDDTPTQCPNCGKIGGKWKSSDVNKMLSFKMYVCGYCHRTVEERQPPKYPCDFCGEKNWKLFKG